MSNCKILVLHFLYISDWEFHILTQSNIRKVTCWIYVNPRLSHLGIKNPKNINSEGDKTRKTLWKAAHEQDLYQTEEKNKSIDANRLMIRFLHSMWPFCAGNESDLIIHQKIFVEIQFPVDQKRNTQKKKQKNSTNFSC